MTVTYEIEVTVTAVTPTGGSYPVREKVLQLQVAGQSADASDRIAKALSRTFVGQFADTTAPAFLSAAEVVG